MKMKIALLFTSFFLSTTFLAGCGEESGEGSGGGGGSTPSNPDYVEATFYNYNKDVLFYTSVKYGGDVTYQGSTPTRPADGEYEYTFVGWDKPLTGLKSNTNFIAQYTSGEYIPPEPIHPDRVEVTFKNYNQEVLFFTSIPYGEDATYQGPVPTRPADGAVTYFFSGWDKSLEKIKTNTEFIAQFGTKETTFVTSWYNYDDELITVTNTRYGELPKYTGTIPSKPATDEYEYEFVGWEPELEPAYSDASYTAVFEEKPIGGPSDPTRFRLSFIYTVYAPGAYSPEIADTTAPSDIGSVSQAGVYTKGADVNLYANPATGYEFVGWYYNGHNLSTNTEYNFKTWEDNIRLEARFRYQTYRLDISSSNASFGQVSFSSNYMYTSTYGNFYYTQKVTLYTRTYDDIRFIGWYDENNSLYSYDGVLEFSMPHMDYSLTAKWNKFFVNYYLNGGHFEEEYVESYSYVPGDDRYITLTKPVRTGYNFDGWYFSTEYYDVVTELDKSLLKDYTVYASWSPIVYTIAYDGNNATEGLVQYQSMTYDIGSYTLENWFYRKGYTFIGWNTEEDGSGTSFDENQYIVNLTTVDDDVIFLYAMWQANTYKADLRYVDPYTDYSNITVSFVTNGANEYVDDQVLDVYHPLQYPGYLTKDGYAFRGWFKDENCQELFNFSEVIKEDTTLYAGWRSLGYSTGVAVNAVEYNSDYPIEQYFTGTGYHYYYFTALDSGTVSLYYKTTSSTYYYAYYISIFNDTTSSTIYSNLTVSSSSYSHYDFEVIAGNVYYLAVRASYDYYYFTGTFFFDGFKYPEIAEFATHYDTYSITYDDEYNLPSPITNAGYAFDGWCDEEGNKITDANGQGLDVWNIDKDTKLYTSWSYEEYDITYELNGGTNSENNPDTYTVKGILTLEEPTKKGYTFKGWYKDSSFTDEFISFDGHYDAPEDLHLYAKWEANQYKVTLYVEDVTFDTFTVTFMNGDEVYDTQTVTSENGLSYPAYPTKSGYVFKGWYKDAECTELFDLSTGVDRNLTVYAGWYEMPSESYYSRNVIDAGQYSSSNYFSMSVYGYSSSKDEIYVSALTSGYKYIYFANNSSSTFYRYYLRIVNVTTGVVIRSNSYVGSIYFDYVGFEAKAGDVIKLEMYYYSNYATAEFYFTNFNTPNAGGLSVATTHVYDEVTLTYGEDYYLPFNYQTQEFEFNGWYDKDGNQLTDEFGNSLKEWDVDEDVTLYGGTLPPTANKIIIYFAGVGDFENISSVHVALDGEWKEMSKHQGSEGQYVAVFNVASAEALNFYFVENNESAWRHPASGTDNWDLEYSTIDIGQLTLVSSNSYVLTWTGWEKSYEDWTNAWFTYTFTQLA